MFRLTDDLQLLLEGTDLGDFRVSDIPWPFDSFVVLLARPIETMCNAWVDAILVSRGNQLLHPSQPYVEIQLLPTVLDQREYLPQYAIRDMEDALAKKRVSRLRKLFDRWSPAADPLLRTIFPISPSLDIGVSRSALSMAKISAPLAEDCLDPHIEHYPHWDLALRIVAGLALHLTTISGHSRHAPTWTRPDTHTLDFQAVVSDALVCEVSSTHILSANERQNLREAIDDERSVAIGKTTSDCASREVRAHYRRGYWRRAPGSGNDPNAPKCIHVRPTLVRSDRLPQGAAPQGAESRFKT
jgi:hypothetical protein